MTKTEHLTSLQRKDNRFSAALSPKRRKRNFIIIAIMLLGTVLICMIGTAATAMQKENKYRQAIEDPNQISVGILDYKDAFAVWNREICGNDANTLLAGGMVYSRNGITVLPSVSKQRRYIIKSGGKQVGQIDSYISSINLYGDFIYYKDNGTKKIMAFNMKTAKSTSFLAENVGSFFISSNRLFYTDLSKNSSLFSIDFAREEDPVLLVNGPIDQFAVLGESVLFRGYDNVLYLLSMTNNHLETVGKSVERFFLDGSLILESGNIVYRTKPDGTKPEKLFESSQESFKLVGACSGLIFYQEEGLLYKLDQTGESEALNSTRYADYCSITINDDTLYALGIKDGTSTEASFEMIELPFANMEASNE